MGNGDPEDTEWESEMSLIEQDVQGIHAVLEGSETAGTPYVHMLDMYSAV